MKPTDDLPSGANMSRSQLLTRREAATYLGVSEQTLAAWKCTGRRQVPCIKIGRMVRYRKADLDSFIAKHAEGYYEPLQ
jgi:excisionase family DNA binding protein